MIGIDTNVIARHLLGDDAVQSSTASEFLHTLTPERPGFITHVTLVEPELFGVRDVVTFDRSAARRLGWTALAS